VKLEALLDHSSNPAGLRDDAPGLPVIVIVERQILTRTCILSILKRELAGFEIIEMATTDDLDRALGRNVCLIALSVGDNSVFDPCVENDLALLARSFPDAPFALLSNRDDETAASAAMRRGVRGFFPTSIPVEVAIAGLRLVLAGGAYRPLRIDISRNEAPAFDTLMACINSSGSFRNDEVNCIERVVSQQTMIELTPREKHVLAALELGLPNKLIAARLNLSENTVKMHIQHIMRKCSARNRTEAVLLCTGRLSHNDSHAGAQTPS
jgi:DNA-binding NarL/FixJ family response regulator